MDKVKSVLGGVEANISSYGDAASFFAAMDRNNPFHIVISDIRMEGMNGIELGRKLKRLCPEVYLIYLTLSSDYAADSYILNAYQYVLKCDMDVRLPEILKAALSELEKELDSYRIVGSPNRRRRIRYEDIICINKVKGTKYVEYVTADGSFRDRKTLEQVMEEASQQHFVMVERGHVVNMGHVVSFEERTLTLSNGEEMAVSRTRNQAVREALHKYWCQYNDI